MFVDMIGDRILRPERRGEHERELVLTNHVADAIALAGLRPSVSQTLKTKCCLVKMRSLLGITDIKFDVISALQGKKILLRLMLGLHPFGHGALLFFRF